ncbi:MAG: glycerophosphodiester phosphodiesterase [Bacteroidetes bacterium]|nr:glycerophosphodiester phosphodiesterase [Bacteroidota bacterium]
MRLINIILLSLLASTVIAQTSTIDIGGNRGFRGMYPENSIHGFVRAVKLGVNTIEMDVVISKDNQVVVSHDLTIDEDVCSHPDGKPMTGADKDKYKIYTMTYDEIKKFDCGARGNSRFTDQVKEAAYKPLLSEVIDAVEKYIKENNLTSVNYNIQIVSSKKGDEVMHPEPPQYSKLVYDVVKGKGIAARTLFASLDMRILQELHKADEAAMTSLMSEKTTDVLETNLKDLHFNPTVYSPTFLLCNKAMIAKCHALGIKVIAWTPNEITKMIALKNDGVDGLITDYPDRAIKALRPK